MKHELGSLPHCLKASGVTRTDQDAHLEVVGLLLSGISVLLMLPNAAVSQHLEAPTFLPS